MRTVFIIIIIPLSILFAQKQTVQEQFLATPKLSANGIIFSDHLNGGLFRAFNNSVLTISDRKGSGEYFTISNDKTLIGFKEIDDEGKQQSVMYNVHNNVKTVLHVGSSQVGQVSFSNNGVIAFTVEKELFVAEGSSTQIFNLGAYSNLAPISPDGNSVAYNDNADQLWIIELRTGVSTKITDDNASYFLPQWSPDGSQLLFSSLRGNLFTYSIISKDIISLCDGFSPSWIDNKTILFYQKNSAQEQLISSDLFTIDINQSIAKQITFTDDCFEIDPSFDTKTQMIYYSDVQHQGIYSRRFLITDKRVLDETEILSYRAIPTAVKHTLNPTSINHLKKTTATYFEMPYVHQVWDTPDWYNGHSACGATSSIMVIAYYNIVPKWNVWCSASGSSPGHYSPYGNYVCEQYAYKEVSYSASASDPNGKLSYGGYGFMWTGSYSPHSRTVDYYKYHGMGASLFDSPSHGLITAEIDSGYPFTLCNTLTTAGHIVVVNGYDVNNRTLVVNDPYGNKNSGTYPSLNGKGVKYDWPGYNNGYKNFNTIEWGVSVRYNNTVTPDSLVDDSQLDKGFFLYSAVPSKLVPWSTLYSGYNNRCWWTRTKSSDTCFATWTENLERDGMYEVYAYIPISEATIAKYKVYAKDGTHTVIGNQKNVKNDWLSLGTFPFAKENSAVVRLGDGSDSVKQAIVFDAVKWNYRSAIPTSVLRGEQVSNSFSLEQNYPNPFNPSTVINYQLPITSFISLKVFDVLGKEVATLVNEIKEAGTHSVTFSASQLSSGLYFYKITTGTFSETKKMSLQK